MDKSKIFMVWGKTAWELAGGANDISFASQFFHLKEHFFTNFLRQEKDFLVDQREEHGKQAGKTREERGNP